MTRSIMRNRASVLEMKAAGKSNGEIARTLHISGSTVRVILSDSNPIAPPPGPPNTAGTGIRVPEVALANEVILQAFRDIKNGRVAASRYVASDPKILTAAELASSKAFLMSEEPHWARAREFWADLAGVNPDAVRRAALQAVRS